MAHFPVRGSIAAKNPGKTSGRPIKANGDPQRPIKERPACGISQTLCMCAARREGRHTHSYASLLLSSPRASEDCVRPRMECGATKKPGCVENHGLKKRGRLIPIPCKLLRRRRWRLGRVMRVLLPTLLGFPSVGFLGNKVPHYTRYCVDYVGNT